MTYQIPALMRHSPIWWQNFARHLEKTLAGIPGEFGIEYINQHLIYFNANIDKERILHFIDLEDFLVFKLKYSN